MVADQDNEGDEFSHVSHVIGSKFSDLVRDDGHRAIVLDGGAGVDTLDMGAHTDGVTVSFDGKANDGNDEDETESGDDGKRDLVTNFENVIGTAGDDKLTGDAKENKLEGGAGNDKLYGLDGSDQLNGGFGADTLSGGDGVDTALYTDRTDPNDSLVITLDGGANDGSAVNDDTVSSGGAAHDNVGTTIENVRSGAGNDTITGSSAANVLYGGGGDDTLSGGDGNDTFRGDAGADIFSGGAGADTVTYTDRTTSTSGIVVTIGSGTANDGSSTDASVDPASTARDDVRGSVENVIGGAGGDSLTGSSAANRLTGGPGVDKLYGLGGNDALSAKDGVKDGRIDGGTGTDTASRDSIDPSPISVP
jgi:Ca2+-binding RTX toxin-like protein